MKKNNLDTLDACEKETLATLLQSMIELHIIPCEDDDHGLSKKDLINILVIVKKLNLRINISCLEDISQKIINITDR